MTTDNHEQARGDGSRADGIEPDGGQFVDSDIPGEPRPRSDEPAGEFVDSEVPGSAQPTGARGENAYDESDIPGERTPDDDAAPVGHFTDSDIPGNRDDSARTDDAGNTGDPRHSDARVDVGDDTEAG